MLHWKCYRIERNVGERGPLNSKSSRIQTRQWEREGEAEKERETRYERFDMRILISRGE